MATSGAAVVVKVESSDTIPEGQPEEKQSDNASSEPVKEKIAEEVVNGENKDGAAIENNAEDIKSEEEDEEGSLVLDDFLDSLDVLDSWNPDEDELEGIGEDQPQHSSDKDKKDNDDGRRRERSKDKGRRSRRDLDEKRSTRRRSSHRDRSSGVDLFDVLGPKSSRRRSIHRESSLERPARSRHFAEAAKEVKDLRELIPVRREHKDWRDHRDRTRDYRRDNRDRDRDRERHREKEKPREKQVEKSKEGNVESDVKPPPGIVPAPHVKMPSDDLVPPGTEDEFWTRDEDSNLEPHVDVKNGTIKEKKTCEKYRYLSPGSERSSNSPSVRENLVSGVGRKQLISIARECMKRRGNSEEVSLARTWAIKLKRTKPDQKLLAEKFINDILFEAQLGTLHRHSVCINANVTGSSSPSTSFILDSNL